MATLPDNTILVQTADPWQQSGDSAFAAANRAEKMRGVILSTRVDDCSSFHCSIIPVFQSLIHCRASIERNDLGLFFGSR
jgi:hypothetical protein